MTDERRKAYNRARYQQQKKQSDELKRFKELYPERYAELMAKVKAEMEHSVVKAEPIVRAGGSAAPNIDYMDIPDILKYKDTPFGRVKRQWPLTTEDLDEIFFPPDKREVYVHFLDTWGKEHLIFKTISYPVDDVEQAILNIVDTIPDFNKLTKYELCTCPACIKRHGN